VTTGNFMGFDAWIEGGANGHLSIVTNRGNLEADIQDIGMEERVLDAGGLERQLRVFRLPDKPLEREMTFKREISIEPGRDNPIWICVTTEDGYQAWTSPVYIFQ